MLTLDVFHHYTFLTFPSESPILNRKISSLISYTPPNHSRRRQHFKPHKVSLYTGQKFPTGCLDRLLELLNKLGIEFSLQDHRGVPAFILPKLDAVSVEYRDYQLRGIETGLQSGGRAIFSWPPGTGKTELLIGLVASIGLPTLWLTSSKNVLAQTISRLNTRLSSDNCPKVKVCLPESLWPTIRDRVFSKENPLDKYKVLIIDECHHTGAKTWYDIAMNCNAAFRFAVSATPFDRKVTNLHLQCAVGGNLDRMSYAECYKGGWLSRLTVRMLYYNGGEKILSNLEVDWSDLYRVGIVNNSSRNKLALDEAEFYLQHGLHPLLMVRLVQDHAYPLYDKACLRFGSENVGLITGSYSVEERELALQRLVDKRLSVLISTCILGEGQDVPELSALINLSGGTSKIQTIQIAGRTMRPDSISCVSDFVDRRSGILFRHSGTRRNCYSTMGAEIHDIFPLQE